MFLRGFDEERKGEEAERSARGFRGVGKEKGQKGLRNKK